VIVTTRDAWNNDRLSLIDMPSNVMISLQGAFHCVEDLQIYQSIFLNLLCRIDVQQIH
jgi:hypothetical protein